MVTSIAQQSSPALEQVLSQLKGVRTSMRGWRACCPAHADRKPSLSIGLGEHGRSYSSASPGARSNVLWKPWVSP